MKSKYFFSVVLCMVTGASLQGANQNWLRPEISFTGSTAEFNAIASLLGRVINCSGNNPYRDSNDVDYKFAGSHIAECLVGPCNYVEDDQWRQDAIKSYLRTLERNGIQVKDQNRNLYTVYPDVDVARNRLGFGPRKRTRSHVNKENERKLANQAAKNAGLGSFHFEVSTKGDGMAWIINKTKRETVKRPLDTNFRGKSLKTNRSSVSLYYQHAFTSQERIAIHESEQQA